MLLEPVFIGPKFYYCLALSVNESYTGPVEFCSNCWMVVVWICQNCHMYFSPFAKENQSEVWPRFQILKLLLWTKVVEWVKVLNALPWTCCSFGNVCCKWCQVKQFMRRLLVTQRVIAKVIINRDVCARVRVVQPNWMQAVNLSDKIALEKN